MGRGRRSFWGRWVWGEGDPLQRSEVRQRPLHRPLPFQLENRPGQFVADSGRALALFRRDHTIVAGHPSREDLPQVGRGRPPAATVVDHEGQDLERPAGTRQLLA